MSGGQVRIEQMYAYIATDPADNTEGVVAAIGPSGLAMPLVGADMARADQMWPVAERIAKETGTVVRLVHFTNRVDVDTINPGGSDG